MRLYAVKQNTHCGTQQQTTAQHSTAHADDMQSRLSKSFISMARTVDTQLLR